MDEQKWISLVRRLDARAKADPGRYRRRVAAVAMLGYAYIGLALALLLALAGGAVYLLIHHPGILAVKLLIPIVATALVIARSLSVRIDPPEGIPLSREDAPGLFGLLDEVNADVRGPKVDQVLLDSDLNAGIIQVPRVGGVIGSRNYLVIGLPLLQALTPDEFRAVLAHELAHLSRRHGRFGIWLYRVRATWLQLLGALEERRSAATVLFRRFFEWYVPTFAAHTFPLMRAHEFEADRIAADAVGAQALADALTRLKVANGFLVVRYWPSVFSRASDEPAPPTSAFAELGGAVAAAGADDEAQDWIERALSEEPDETDSHPSLKQRLEALGVDAARASSPGERPAEQASALLGEREAALAERLGTQWQREIAAAWKEEHERSRRARAKLEALEQHAEALDADDRLELARLTEELRDADEAERRYRAVLEIRPDDAVAHYAVGRLLLERDDDHGLAELERAMEADPEAILPACEIAESFLAGRRRTAEAARYRERREARSGLLLAAAAEREDFGSRDEIDPVELPEDVRADVRRRLAALPMVESAYIVRKRLAHLADEYPHYVVCVVAGKVKTKEGEPSLAQQVANTLELPGDFHVIVRRRRSDDAQRFAATARDPVFSRT